MTICALLSETARSAPERPAVIAGKASMSFGELEARCARLAAGLESLGLRRGMRAALMVPPGPDFYALTFGLFRLGAVPVLIDPGIGWKNLGRCLAEAEPEAFIGAPRAQCARLLGGWAKGRERLFITSGRRWFWGGATVAQAEALGARRPAPADVAAPEETAAILFTSGSTGAPKGAVYTHAIFSSQVEFLRRHFEIRAGEVSVPTFPLFGLFDAALGMTVVIARMDFTRPAQVDPAEIIGPVLKYGAAQLFGSPALLDRVGRYGRERGVRLPSLKRVISAGAPVSPAVIARVREMLGPQAVVHTPYGATEALPVSCIEDGELLGETAALSAQGRGTCVGRPLPGMEAFVIAISDDPIPSWSRVEPSREGEVGEIVVKGPVVTRAYFGRPEATAAAKIPGADGEVYHRMGDLGYRDGGGRLWFCGRKSQRVRAGGKTLFTIPCEAVFNQHGKVRRTALVGAGGGAALCVEPEDWSDDQESLRTELLALGAAHEHTKGITAILFHRSFPVDTRHNAKIFREKLAVWAEAELRR